MEGIGKIKEKIMNDSKEEADKIKAAAEKEISEINDKNSKVMKNHETEFNERTNSLVELYNQKTLAQARLKAKKEKLSKREDIINVFIDESINEINFKGKDYKKFLENALKNSKNVLDGNLKIKCNKRDIKIIEELLEKSKMSVNVISEDINGGMILEDKEGKVIDESLSLVLENKKNEIRQEIVKIIGE